MGTQMYQIISYQKSYEGDYFSQKRMKFLIRFRKAGQILERAAK